MDCGYYVSLLVGMALAFVGPAAGFTGLKVALEAAHSEFPASPQALSACVSPPPMGNRRPVGVN